jgi:PAS domain S-box-containing protein
MYIASPICGFISFILGVIVLFGWYTHSPTLIQVHPSFVAMQYNTALGFLACGIGLLAIFKSKEKIIKSCGLFLIFLGSLTLIQYIFRLNFGIDQLFMEHYIDQESSHPGRMAPNTALCFLLVGLSFLRNPKEEDKKISTTSFAILGSLVWALGTVAFAGYAMELETAYGWGNLTRMAVHTASGFIVMGVGIIIHSWNIQRREKFGTPHWLPLLAGLVTFTITLLIWQAQSSEQDRRTLDLVTIAAKNIESELNTELEGRVNGLERRAKRWERGQIPTREEFIADINLYIEQHVSMIGSLWVDSHFNIQYWEPKDTDTNLITGIEKQKELMSSMMKARDESKTIALGGFLLSTGERVLLVLIPVFQKTEFQGLLVGILQPRKLLAETLSTQIDEGISAEALGPAELEREVIDKNITKNRWMVERNISFLNVPAKVKVYLNEEGLKKKSSFVANAILIVGIFISFLLAQVIRIAQQSRKYARQTEVMNLELEMERTHLEERVHERTQELEDSEDQFRSLVNNIPGVSYRCLFDKNWTMLYISDGIKALSGYPPEDFIQNAVRTFVSITHLDDKKMIAQAVDQSMEKKEPFTVEYRVTHADGRILWVREKGQVKYRAPLKMMM